MHFVDRALLICVAFTPRLTMVEVVIEFELQIVVSAGGGGDR